MGYQFLHVECYARNAGKGKEGGHTIRTISEESDRIEGAFPHVERPERPIIRHGVSATEAANLAEKWAETATDARGHKLRKDGLCLVGGVISYPNDAENWEKFRDNSIKWLKNKYGNCLKSVIEHTDEPFRHIHFYVVPNAGERFESIHEGRRASGEAKAKKLVKGAQNRAYIEAMRVLQDEFSAAVAMLHGLTRLGPKKRRLTRAGWRHEQRMTELFASLRAHYRYGRKKGYADGMAKARRETDAVAEKVAGFIAEVGKKVLGPFHKPTAKANVEIQSLEALALAEKAKRNKAEQRIKEEALRVRAEAKLEIDRLARVASSFELENSRHLEKIEELNAELQYYRRAGKPVAELTL